MEMMPNFTEDGVLATMRSLPAPILCRNIAETIGADDMPAAIKAITGILRRLVRRGLVNKTVQVRPSRTAYAWVYEVAQTPVESPCDDFIHSGAIARKQLPGGGTRVRFGTTWKPFRS